MGQLLIAKPKPWRKYGTSSQRQRSHKAVTRSWKSKEGTWMLEDVGGPQISKQTISMYQQCETKMGKKMRICIYIYTHMNEARCSQFFTSMKPWKSLKIPGLPGWPRRTAAARCWGSLATSCRKLPRHLTMPWSVCEVMGPWGSPMSSKNSYYLGKLLYYII